MTPEDLCAVMGITFSPEQLAGITAPLAPGVIIAGAGTGKTTVMAARVVWLTGTGQVEPHEVLGLTFTRKAAAELGERIAAALQQAGLCRDGDEGRERVSTYDSFAARIVTEHGLRAGMEAAPALITGALPYQLMERAVRGAPGPYPCLSEYQSGTIVQRALKLDAELQSHLVSIDEAATWTREAGRGFHTAPGHGTKVVKPYADLLTAAQRCAQRLELLDIVQRYREIKRTLSVAEYADQLHTAASLAGEITAIRAELRSSFRVVLLDEYQDTSSAQAQLLSALFAGHPVTAVGDPYQAIYGWRGAAASNILEFAKDFGEAQRYSLTVNRRSSTRILDVGNALAGMIPGDDGVLLRAPDGTAPGLVEAARFESESDEVSFIAQQIAQLEGVCRWSEVAVLCRRNATLAVIHEALRMRDVPTEIVGVGGLLHVPEIVPIVATLRLLSDPLANAALASLLTGARWQLPLTDMARLARRAQELVGDEREGLCLLEAVLDPPSGLSGQGGRALSAFKSEFARLGAHASDPLPDLVQRIIRTIGVEEELRARGQDLSQLEAFVAVCANHQNVVGEGSLTGLIAYFDAETTWGMALERATISSEDSVKLLTIHRAKGLEWEHVFLPCLIDGVFPSAARGGNWVMGADLLPGPLRGDAHAVPQLGEYSKQALDEFKAELQAEHGHGEDRLAYVAATRARSRLVGTCHRWSPGVKRERRPSRYFEAIRTEADRGGHAIDLTSDSPDNPLLEHARHAPWPEREADEVIETQRSAAELVHRAMPANEEWVTQSAGLSPEVARDFADWDVAAAHVLSQRVRREVRLTRGLSATSLIALRDDPQAFAEQLMRRMPREPSRAATLGSRFHEWIQRRYEGPGSFDEFERHDVDLTALIGAFERGRFANLTPIAVEVPFVMSVRGMQVRGRMDAVFAWEGDYDEVVIDWKTSDVEADELQLAVYRRAWAEARGMDPARVGAAFHHVRPDRLVFATASPALIDEALTL